MMLIMRAGIIANTSATIATITIVGITVTIVDVAMIGVTMFTGTKSITTIIAGTVTGITRKSTGIATEAMIGTMASVITESVTACIGFARILTGVMVVMIAV